MKLFFNIILFISPLALSGGLPAKKYAKLLSIKQNPSPPIKKSSTSSRKVNSNQDIRVDLEARFQELWNLCGDHSLNQSQRTTAFIRKLQELKSYAETEGVLNTDINLDQRILLNSISAQIQTLVEDMTITNPGDLSLHTASDIKIAFEHNYRYYHQIPEHVSVMSAGPWWVKHILKTLACMETKESAKL